MVEHLSRQYHESDSFNSFADVCMGGLSVIVITLNEERNIVDCLESVKWTDEIVVVDAKSADRTVELASRYTDKVFVTEWLGYADAKNFALSKAANDWVLWLDSDERVTPTLADEVRNIVAQDDTDVAGYTVARRAYFLGRWIKHCGWYPARATRLFRKDKGKFCDLLVHEKLVLDGEIKRLQNDLLHYTDNDLEHYFDKLNRYTTLASQDITRTKGRFRIADLLIRPPFEFFQMYILKLGFLDGMQGFILSVLSACYVFAKYAKVWQRTKHR